MPNSFETSRDFYDLGKRSNLADLTETPDYSDLLDFMDSDFPDFLCLPAGDPVDFLDGLPTYSCCSNSWGYEFYDFCELSC